MSEFRAPFEWEQLDKPLVLNGESLEALGEHLNVRPKKFEIKRNQDYKIEVSLTGNIEAHKGELTNFKTISGQTIKGDNLTFNTLPFEKYTLTGFIPGSTSSNGHGEYTIKAHIGSITFERGSEQQHSFIIHALNCPDMNFPDSTSWGDEGDTTITVGQSRNQSFDGYKYKYPNRGGGFSFNSAYLKNKYGTAVFKKLDDKELNSFRPCSLHFFEGGALRDESLREKWLLALGYFVGSRIIPVSRTSLCARGYPIKQKSFSPYILDDYLHPSMPPTKATEQNGFHQDAEVLSKQIELFIDNYERLNLDTVIWNLWFGRSMPQGLNMVGYSASLEALSKAFFQNTHSDVKKTYVDSTKFNELVSPLLKEIKTLANTDIKWNKVSHKMADANNLSAHQRIWFMFETLNLSTSQVEKDVINSRHKLAHGSSIGDTDFSFIIKAARAYEVIINRCVLATLQASDKYIDYSTHGFPTRELMASLGGSDISRKEKV